MEVRGPLCGIRFGLVFVFFFTFTLKWVQSCTTNPFMYWATLQAQPYNCSPSVTVASNNTLTLEAQEMILLM